MNPILLILTIGTGTRGEHSNLAAGMISTIRKTAPRLFWLVPSGHKDSRETANLVREEMGEEFSFQAWSESEPYCCIEQPDDLFSCRASLREVIARARGKARRGERLIVNPTSGTKQMSVGATLAALDAEIGEIVFTTGERSDGVVKTGTERLTRFETQQFFAERTWREARRLVEFGSFRGAANLLEEHAKGDLKEAREVALCLYEWQRLNYEWARQIAASSSAPELGPCRGHLEMLARSPELSIEHLGDLLASADALLGWEEPEEALARYYRGMEMAAKIRLKEGWQIAPPYDVPALEAACPRLAKRFRELARDGRVMLGLARSMEILESLQDELGQEYWRDQSLRTLLSSRNETFAGHGTKSVSLSEVKAARKATERLLKRFFPNLEVYWTLHSRPEFPALG